MRHMKEPDGLVTVLESSDPARLLVAKSLLEDAEIPYLAKGEGVQDLFAWGRFGTGFSLIAGAVRLQVSVDDAEEAKALLEEPKTE